jgi:crotonobetainyl-CoA:carnitine CoA-transferase CaiB-like acyl-CoA transferase
VPSGLSANAFLADAATDDLRARLSTAFARCRAEALELALNEAGVPASRVRDLGEYLADLYPRTPGIGVVGEPVALGPAFRCVGGETTDLPAAPRLGADNEAYLSEAPTAPARSERMG